jgi:hypothetical protein
MGKPHCKSNKAFKVIKVIVITKLQVLVIGAKNKCLAGLDF